MRTWRKLLSVKLHLHVLQCEPEWKLILHHRSPMHERRSRFEDRITQHYHCSLWLYERVCKRQHVHRGSQRCGRQHVLLSCLPYLQLRGRGLHYLRHLALGDRSSLRHQRDHFSMHHTWCLSCQQDKGSRSSKIIIASVNSDQI